jgi:hypothetical protein
MLKTSTFSPASSLDKDIFAGNCLAAAAFSSPTYVDDIEYDATEHYQRWYQEGCDRTVANSRYQRKHFPKHQHIPGQTLTVDQLGRICEGPIELLLGLDVAAVLWDRTDNKADVALEGIKFDVKGATPKCGNSFAVECEKARGGVYDALLLVQLVQPGLARVWACKCAPVEGKWQEKPGSMAGKKPFYRIPCPALPCPYLALTPHPARSQPSPSRGFF